jgi:hypothetical protein
MALVSRQLMVAELTARFCWDSRLEGDALPVKEYG